MRKLAWTVIASLVALTGPAAGTVDESSGTVTAASPAPDDQSGTVRRIVFSDGLQQKASGELAIVNLDGNSYSQDLSTLSLFDLCVRNYRSTPASSVWVEVWASTQIPQIGGDLTHFTVATYAFGLVNGYSTRCQDTGAIPMTAPNPGQYWISVVVYEGSGTGRTLQYVYTDTEKSDFGGPFGNKYLYLRHPLSYSITSGGTTASLQAGRIQNDRATATGQLELSLIATTDVPRYGGYLNWWPLVSKQYGPLSPGYGYPSPTTGSLPTTQPPPGTYWISALLQERGADGVWYYYSVYTFPNRFTFTGTSAAPTADFTFSPATPIIGQTVTFTDASTGDPTSWSWSFGNGATASTRNTAYTFTTAGTYSVSLTASNAGGASTRTKSITVLSPAAPLIAYFRATPSSVVSGQQAVLSWASTGATSATIDQGVGAVPISGSIAVTPIIGKPYRLTVTGPGGSASATVTITAVSTTYIGSWLLPSSAKTSGSNAFWTTDLSITNSGTESADVLLKFLGHDGNGAAGQEVSYTIPARSTFTRPDVLSSVFGRERDWGPILVRSTVTTLVVQGQTSTPAPTGAGTYGQSVPALGASETVGASRRTLTGVRQDEYFRTNIVLANMKDTAAAISLQVLLADGTTVTEFPVTVGAYGFLQLNLKDNLGVANFSGGSVIVSSSTPGAQVAVYASVIDAATGDPRSILGR